MILPQLVLASASPRRKELLANAHIPYIVTSHSYIEEAHPLTSPGEYVKELSFQKARHADLEGIEGDLFVLGVDTVVFFEGTILGKPKSSEEALENIQALSGREHSVFSGVTLLNPANNLYFSEYAETKVTFSQLDNDFLKYYIAEKQYEGFAGGYAIQGIFSLVVSKITGSYTNVVGLPMETFYMVCKKAGFAIYAPV